MVNAKPWPLYLRERPSTHCIGLWVGPRAHQDGCRKCRPRRGLIPGPSSYPGAPIHCISIKFQRFSLQHTTVQSSPHTHTHTNMHELYLICSTNLLPMNAHSNKLDLPCKAGGSTTQYIAVCLMYLLRFYVYGSVYHNIFYEITNRCSFMQSILLHF